jgi:hypothetical protein
MELSTTNTLRHTYQYIQFNMGFEIQMVLEVGLPDLSKKNISCTVTFKFLISSG